jgi:subtilisin family serine protease
MPDLHPVSVKYIALAILFTLSLSAAFHAFGLPDRQGPWAETGPAPVVEISSPWWERSAMDADRNGIADVLDPFPAMYGDDRPELDVIVSFSRDIAPSDIAWIEGRGYDMGSVIDPIDAVTLFNVGCGRIYELFSLQGVVFIEPLGTPVLFSDVAVPTVLARGSDLYGRNVWDLGYKGSGVSLAIIDTGIDDEHPSLEGKWLGGVDMTKPDNLEFLYPQDGTFDPDDIQGHGSTCAGIATGTGAPEGAYTGSAPDAHLVEIRIGTKIGYAPGEFWAGAQGDPQLKDGTVRGINWGIDFKDNVWSNGGSEYEGIDIFSLSWGVDVGQDSDGTDAYSRLLDAAVDEGLIVVNAAGNDGPSNTGFTGLSASSKAIIVAATDDLNTVDRTDDTIAEYSSRGPRTDNGDGDPYDELKPDVAAPGTNINNLQPDTRRILGDASQNGYGGRGSGTSYATPLVAGVVALMLQANPELEGRNDLVKEILRYTAERRAPPTLPDLDPFWERDGGWGTVNAYDAVQLALAVEDPDSIDVDLQAHITSPLLTNLTQTAVNVSSGSISIEGLGWSRGGAFDGTEYRLNGGEWRPVTRQNDSGFHPFVAEVKGLEAGRSNTIEVRSVGGNRVSLADSICVLYTPVEQGPTGGSSTVLFGVLGALALLGIGALVARRYVTSSRRSG